VLGRENLRVIAMGAEVTSAIGLNMWAAFAGESDAAHIAGDVAMLESEVNAVIGALRKHNLEVVAVHQHMLEERLCAANRKPVQSRHWICYGGYPIFIVRLYASFISGNNRVSKRVRVCSSFMAAGYPTIKDTGFR
jgi:Domain of Unknown Function (DUF1259)